LQGYIIRRLLLIIPTLLLVTMIVFCGVRLVPGDIIDQMVAEHAFASTLEKHQTVEAIRAKLGLDVPIPQQYGRFLRGIITRGDLGESLWKGTPVTEEILFRLPATIELGIIAMIVAVLIALPIGILSAVRQDTAGDYAGRTTAMILISIPYFWVGLVVVIAGSLWFGWSPSTDYVSFFENPLENLGMFLVPALVLGVVMSGITMRMTRTMMLEVLRQDYIRTAWAKGLRESVIIVRHAVKNALIPVVTIIGLQIPVVVGGAVVIEQIFNIPGIGRLMLESIHQRDYTIISGINLLVASFVLVINLAVDLSYSYLDPRVRYR